MAMAGIVNVPDSLTDVEVVVFASKNLNNSFCMCAAKQMDSKTVNTMRMRQEYWHVIQAVIYKSNAGFGFQS